MLNRNKKILIVEDDEGIAELQRIRLERCGHDVMCVKSAQEALSFLDSGKRVDLFLLDYSLENEMTGLALFLIIKERGYTAPAILITGFEDPKIIVQAMRAGVRDFLPKSADYLDDLPMTVERVIHQLQLEQQASESVLIKEKQEMLEAAFGAARLAAFVWDPATGEFQCTGHFEDLLGATRVVHLRDLESFIEFINPSDQELFRNAIETARSVNESVETQFRIYRDDGELRWVFVKGRFQFDRNGAPTRFICVLNDISVRKRAELELLRSHEKIKALNDRLQTGMVETNHRVKNHLQKLISLLQHQVRNKHGNLTEEDVQGVVSHIHGLAALHDVLAEDGRVDGDGMTVDVSEVLGRVIDVLGGTLEERTIRTNFERCRVTSRQAASLSVILNELLSNALKHGSGPIQVALSCGGTEGLLTVSNEGSTFPEKLDPDRTGRTGLVLVKMLCRTDFDRDPEFDNEDGKRARVRVPFTTAAGENSPPASASQA